MPLVRSFAQACKIKKLDPKKIIAGVSIFPLEYHKALLATAQMFIIAEVLNDEWKADWNNSNQPKWRPWFWMNKPGFRFIDSYCTAALASALTGGGSRLCFKDEKTSDYAAKQFLPIWKAMMVK